MPCPAAGIFLSVTGSEATFADLVRTPDHVDGLHCVMTVQCSCSAAWLDLTCPASVPCLLPVQGHFSKNAIRLAFIGIAYPALVLTYLGQAAWLTANQDLVRLAV